jgi:hypothetical protein
MSGLDDPISIRAYALELVIGSAPWPAPPEALLDTLRRADLLATYVLTGAIVDAATTEEWALTVSTDPLPPLGVACRHRAMQILGAGWSEVEAADFLWRVDQVALFLATGIVRPLAAKAER